LHPPTSSESRKAVVLDPELYEELRTGVKTALVLHIAMLSEPLIYVIVALVFREVSGFRGLEESQSSLPLMRSLFLLLSVLTVPAIVVFRKLLFSPDKLVPSGADFHKVAMAYSRAHMVIDALAVVPATLGFVLFLIGGDMEYLMMLSTASITMLILLFPRRETLERAVTDRILRGERIRSVRRESEHNA
jgi:hypothetical protein